MTKAKVKFVKLIFAPPMELISMAIYSQSMIVQSFYDFLYWNNGGVNSFKKHSNDTFCGNFMINTKSFSFLHIPKLISELNDKLAKCLLIVFDTNLVGLQIGLHGKERKFLLANFDNFLQLRNLFGSDTNRVDLDVELFIEK